MNLNIVVTDEDVHDSKVFLEAVQARHRIGLVTKDPDPKLREVILIQPHYVHMTDDANGRRLDSVQPVLWACAAPYASNHDFPLREIVSWKILSDNDMTSRRIPQKTYRVFEGHPFGHVLLEVDRRLRRAWAEAVSKPDFDPAPFIAKDKRLGEIADEVRDWFPPPPSRN